MDEAGATPGDLLLICQGIRLLLWFQGTAFSLFCAFCMRLLISIHDEIGTAVLPVGFASISRLKSPYKPTVQRVRTREPSERSSPFVREPKTYAHTS